MLGAVFRADLALRRGAGERRRAMKELVSMPIYTGWLNEYGGAEGLRGWLDGLGLDGIEAVWGDMGYVDDRAGEVTVGYHLLFYADFLDFWRGDEKRLLRKFGSREEYVSFYGGADRQTLISQYRADLARAAEFVAEYVVYHVSDVSLEEGYTYRFEHSSQEVIDAAVELINETAGGDPPYTVLVENQWWPGFTFTDPALTERLLGGIRAKDVGILLDCGHLLNCNTELRGEQDGAEYIVDMLRRHGELAKRVRAMHLHRSFSGEYVREHTGSLPPLAPTYSERFAQAYGHILNIDRHQPWQTDAVRRVVECVQPEYLTHELSAHGRRALTDVVRTQRAALGR